MENVETPQIEDSIISFKKIMAVAYPAVISMLSMNIMQIADRTFLSRYSLDDFAASMPAGVLSFSILSVFMGIASYVTALSSQYFGAKQKRRSTRATWQGIYFAIVAGILIVCVSPFTANLFSIIGHDKSLISLERKYFFIMNAFAPFFLTMLAMHGFFNGIGKTKIPMWISLLANSLNIILDYIFIFGKLGLPPMGVGGAALATLISGIIAVLVQFTIFFSKKYRDEFGTLKYFRFFPSMIKRLLRFGSPAGIRFFFVNAAMGVVIMLLGKLGKAQLTAANMAFTIESVAFIPVFGLSIGIGIVSGMEIGAGRIKNVYRVASRGVLAAFIFDVVACVLFLLLTESIINIFNSGSEKETFGEVAKYAVVLVRMATIWVLFDSVSIILSGILNSAGDTLFLLITTIILSSAVAFGLPILFLSLGLNNIYLIWSAIIAYVVINSIVVLTRFLSGAWEKISLIER